MAIDESISGCPFLDCTLRIFDACSDFISTRDFWHVDYDDWFILIEDSNAMISSVFHWYIRLKHWHAGLLMIDLIVSISTLTLILSWLFWSLHMHTLTTVHHFDSTCWSTCRYIILIIFEHDVYITIHLIIVFSLILCVDMMIYLSFAWLRVAWLLSSAWLHAACLCG